MWPVNEIFSEPWPYKTKIVANEVCSDDDRQRKLVLFFPHGYHQDCFGLPQFAEDRVRADAPEEKTEQNEDRV